MFDINKLNILWFYFYDNWIISTKTVTNFFNSSPLQKKIREVIYFLLLNLDVLESLVKIISYITIMNVNIFSKFIYFVNLEKYLSIVNNSLHLGLCGIDFHVNNSIIWISGLGHLNFKKIYIKILNSQSTLSS